MLNKALSKTASRPLKSSNFSDLFSIRCFYCIDFFYKVNGFLQAQSQTNPAPKIITSRTAIFEAVRRPQLQDGDPFLRQ